MNKNLLSLFYKAAVSGTLSREMSYSDISDTNIGSTSSFAYDVIDSPLKSTQQLKVDWSKFEKHTFFSSAEVNVNSAFDVIINGYPFDGTKIETERFFENLTGFEKWVYDQFPKYKGSLHFSGTLLNEDTDGTLGTWIEIKDFAGSLYPEISKNRSGASVLTPKSGSSLSIELQLYLPEKGNENQVICQKLNTTLNHGFSVHILSSSLTSSCNVQFAYVEGSNNLNVSGTIEKGKYNHLCFVLDRDEYVPKLKIYSNEELLSTSRNADFNELQIDNANFYIGTGSAVSIDGTTFLPKQTLSASIDEFRLFHSVRSVDQQKLYAKKSIYATEDLKLYYKFNEPAPLLGSRLSDSVNSIVLDSSGNSLHALISNFTGSLRENYDDHAENPMSYEKLQTSPVLFPAYSDVIDLNIELLSSASQYDLANPNLITKLIPQHYLTQGSEFEGLSNITGTIGNAYSGNGIPGEGVIGSQQLIVSFLYMYAKLFDEIKLFVDSFSNLKFVDYDTNESTPDNFLGRIANSHGFYIPSFFNNASIEQYVDGENITDGISTEQFALQYVQKELMRRILINLPEIVRSKGTQHSVKTFLRAIGVDPENSIRIREYGGPTTRQLSYSRENKRELNYMIQFTTSSLAKSCYLSASRMEVGYPYPSGSMILQNLYNPHGISPVKNDGLLTSGSWTVEAIVKFPLSSSHSTNSISQSIIRLVNTGSNSSLGGYIFNLVAVSSSIPTLELIGCTNADYANNPPVLHIKTEMTNEHIFDGDHWNVCFGRFRDDQTGFISSSYFVRIAKNLEGQVTNEYESIGYLKEGLPTSNYDSLTHISSSWNASGSFIEVGESQNYSFGSGDYTFLSNTSVVTSSIARVKSFVGRMSQLRFWSKGLTKKEWYEHVRNYKSMGVEDPSINWNFNFTSTGSWERLRLDVFSKQLLTSSDNQYGNIAFLDFSKNNNHMSGTGFYTSSIAFYPEIYDYSYLSPYFDEASTDEKIRVRSYMDPSFTVNEPWAIPGTAYEIPKSESPTDDTRLTIEFSLVDALNRDIVLMFATFDALDNALGDPNLVHSPDYPNLEVLRENYFNRIGSKLNFKKFFDFFKWFDTSMNDFIVQLIPKKTNFKGTNFLIESHMLERHKIEHYGQGQYLGDSKRPIQNNLLLQLISGIIRKY